MSDSFLESLSGTRGHFLEAAVDGRADRLVTGDRDLLEIVAIERVQFVSPARFATELG